MVLLRPNFHILCKSFLFLNISTIHVQREIRNPIRHTRPCSMPNKNAEKISKDVAAILIAANR